MVFDWLNSNTGLSNKLIEQGFNNELVIAASNRNSEAVRKLSLQLKKYVQNLRNDRASGAGERSKGLIPESVLARFATDLLDQMAICRIPPELELVALLKRELYIGSIRES